MYQVLQGLAFMHKHGEYILIYHMISHDLFLCDFFQTKVSCVFQASFTEISNLKIYYVQGQS